MLTQYLIEKRFHFTNMVLKWSRFCCRSFSWSYDLRIYSILKRVRLKWFYNRYDCDCLSTEWRKIACICKRQFFPFKSSSDGWPYYFFKFEQTKFENKFEKLSLTWSTNPFKVKGRSYKSRAGGSNIWPAGHTGPRRPNFKLFQGEL